ncbi:putative large protein with signal peptide cysteine-rich,threonine-rich, mucin [Toxoplasma gondii GAB2-2007-GAL-DOM2]|uniref:Putative large protein with signal peptide cysteine-rich,threonine-rich, mucin n=3 Tax=Toxoplasma gondii TaxID=5811 RepID=A0A086LGA3_TOXGO|nr:putative large protein with signal peptide cysteine-rich,threonine-rich, mucin [Toxoplasma gondii GAB2-2007-GAL-DOM2]KFG55671.1 putative large protein with signal peptide cysteine-rich,threonine-rich, mucin [Toxoplasma gondii FOU]PUA92052.1 putative large protein with signal peptide cysteine-rich,threonine-rich, mucin [Toxoplasma gondii TgCATBr9]
MSIGRNQARCRFCASVFSLESEEVLVDSKTEQMRPHVSSFHVRLFCLFLASCSVPLLLVSGSQSGTLRLPEGHACATPSSAAFSSACNIYSESVTPIEPQSSHSPSQIQERATDTIHSVPARTATAAFSPLPQKQDESSGVTLLSGSALQSSIPFGVPTDYSVRLPFAPSLDPRSLVPKQRLAKLFTADGKSTSMARNLAAKTLATDLLRVSRDSATKREVLKAAENISILGRFGENAEINGEYELIRDDERKSRGEKPGGRPVYRKKQMAFFSNSSSAASQEVREDANQSPLYLFHVESSGPANPAFWAVGETLGANERIRAFVLSSADTPDKAEGEWLVFEKSVVEESSPQMFQAGSPPIVVPTFHADPYVAAVPVSCDNGAQDGDETGLDCGGDTCRACDQFRSCRLPAALPTGDYALGDCPSDAKLAHGKACTYKCPLGWREKGALGRICYDGTVLEIRRGAGCERAFELPENATQNCQFLLLDGAPERQQKCNGLFISHIVTGMSGQRAVFWQKDIHGELIQLYWDDGYWLCGSFEKDEEYGYLPDMTPERLIQANSIPLLTSQATWSNVPGPQASALPASLRCVDPLKPLQQIQREGDQCPAFFFSGWSRPELDGYWHELFPPSSDGRPRFINENMLLIHWTPLGYWVVGVPDDDTMALALSFSPSKFPSPNGWRIWNAGKGLWEEEESVRVRCVPTDDRESQSSAEFRNRNGNGSRESYTSTRNSHYGFPAPLLAISASPFLPSSFTHEAHETSQNRSGGLLEGLISPEEGDLRLRSDGRTLLSLDLPKRSVCPRLLLEGGVGLGARCNGVWSRPLSSLGERIGGAESRGSSNAGNHPDDRNYEYDDEHTYYLFKLSIDSRVMYLYKSDDQWRCTADGITLLGFSNENVTLQSGVKEKTKPGSELTNSDEPHSGEANGEEGNWLEGLRYVAGPWRLSCLEEEGSQQKCDELRVSGFADSAEVFNGLWTKSGIGAEGTHAQYTKKTSEREQAAPLFHHRSVEFLLHYHPVGLWVIGKSPESNERYRGPRENGSRRDLPHFFAYALNLHGRVPPGGLWTVFEKAHNRAVLNLVQIECIQHVTTRITR